MSSREHARARHALQAVRDVEGQSFDKQYRSYVDRLGPAILRNGLGQALAGELAAAGSAENDRQQAHQRLYENIESWLCGDDGTYQGKDDVLEALIGGDEDAYLAAHAETLAWLEWHKRFCRAYLRKAPPSEPEG